MKNHFLVLIFCLVAIFSLYSVSALYIGTISMGVGNNINFQVGSGLSFNITNTTNTSSGSNVPVVGSAGVTSGYSTTNYNSSPLNNNVIKNLATTSSQNLVSNLNGSNSSVPAVSSTHPGTNFLTGGVVNALASPGGVSVLGILVFGLVMTLVLVARKRSNNPKENKETE